MTIFNRLCSLCCCICSFTGNLAVWLFLTGLRNSRKSVHLIWKWYSITLLSNCLDCPVCYWKFACISVSLLVKLFYFFLYCYYVFLLPLWWIRMNILCIMRSWSAVLIGLGSILFIARILCGTTVYFFLFSLISYVLFSLFKLAAILHYNA